MGQPSATKHLKTLEAAVGERLVQRNGRASALTEAGEVVATHAQRDHGRPRRTIATSLLPRDAFLTPETALQRGFLRWAILGSNQ